MKRMSSDPAMRDAAFEHNRRMMDMAQLRYEGKREGLAEGREEGRAEGRAEGEMKGCVEVARNLKKMGLPLDTIIQSTGLSVEEIDQL